MKFIAMQGRGKGHKLRTERCVCVLNAPSTLLECSVDYWTITNAHVGPLVHSTANSSFST